MDELFENPPSNPLSFKLKSSFSLPPNGLAYNKIFKAASDKALIGLSKLILFFLAMDSIFLYR